MNNYFKTLIVVDVAGKNTPDPVKMDSQVELLDFWNNRPATFNHSFYLAGEAINAIAGRTVEGVEGTFTVHVISKHNVKDFYRRCLEEKSFDFTYVDVSNIRCSTEWLVELVAVHEQLISGGICPPDYRLMVGTENGED